METLRQTLSNLSITNLNKLKTNHVIPELKDNPLRNKTWIKLIDQEIRRKQFKKENLKAKRTIKTKGIVLIKRRRK